MRTAPLLVVSLVATLGCSKKSQDGLPPAQDWQGGQVGEIAPQQQGTAPRNPHDQGMPMAGNIDPDQPMPPNHPDVSGGGMGGGGMGGPDVTQMGLSAPDPNRKIDPNHHIKGVLKVAANTKALVKPGGAVFLIVKRAGADGQPSGPPLAVDKVLYADNLPFELTEAHAMVAGTEFTGDVILQARFDQDSDAISKQPGDVLGQAKLKIPADKVELTLDTVLP